MPSVGKVGKYLVQWFGKSRLGSGQTEYIRLSDESDHYSYYAGLKEHFVHISLHCTWENITTPALLLGMERRLLFSR